MRLYKFLDKDGGLKTLEFGKLKVSRFAAVNDPFELKLGQTGIPSEKVDRARREARIQIAKRNAQYGMICFSSTAQEPVLWSHYADCHRGLVLEISVTDSEHRVKINYSDERPCVDYEHPDLEESDYCSPIFEALLRTKSKGWSYEKEYRIYEELEDCDISGGLYFTLIPAKALHRVILGWRSEIEESYVQRLLNKSGFADCKVTKARAQEQSFLIEYEGSDDLIGEDQVKLGE